MLLTQTLTDKSIEQIANVDRIKFYVITVASHLSEERIDHSKKIAGTTN